MENDYTQHAILCELRLIRRAVRGILVLVACGIVLAVLSAIHPALFKSLVFLAGIVAVAAAAGAVLGLGSAKVINRMKANRSREQAAGAGGMPSAQP